MKKLCYPIFIFTLLSSCEREKLIDFELPFEGEKTVVYGLVGPDQSPSLELLLTQAPLSETPSVRIADAQITLLEEGRPVADFLWETRRYVAPFLASSGKSYTLALRYRNTEIVSKPVVVPSLVEISSVHYSISQDSSRLNLRFSFQDRAGERNYYTYSISKYKGGKPIEEIPANFSALQTDEAAPDKLLELNIQTGLKVFLFDSQFQLLDIVSSDAVLLKLYHVSEDFAFFYNSLENNAYELGNQFSGQKPPWTNLSDGYGFWGAYNVDSVWVKW